MQVNILDAKSRSELVGKSDQDTYYIPCRQSDKYAAQVAEETIPVVKKHKDVALLDRVALNLVKHLAFTHADTQHQKSYSQSTPNKIANSPGEMFFNKKSGHCT